YLLPFAAGTALAFVTQSATAVTIVLIGFAQAWQIGPFPSMMAIYGANVGSTFARMALSSSLRGSVRRLTAFQDLFKISGAILFVTLLYLEALEHIPLIHAAASLLSDRLDRQMAVVFLLFNLGMAILFTLFQRPILEWLERRLPPDKEESFSQPK